MPIDFRAIIVKRLADLGNKTPYWLAEKVQFNPSRNAIYTFLNGKGTNMRSDHLARILEALDLRVTPKK